MSKKTILLTFLSAVAVICLAGVLSYLVWTNQPAADSTPPIPPIPGGAPTDKPFVPVVPRLAGDILDDGIVDSLDINKIVVAWKTVLPAYNLVDASSEKTGIISALDLTQTIKYWKCVEQKGEAKCPYLVSITGGEGTVTPTPTTTAGSSATSTTSSTVTTSATTSPTSTAVVPPVPPIPAN